MRKQLGRLLIAMLLIMSFTGCAESGEKQEAYKEAYNKAEILEKEKNYNEAIIAFQELGDYKDSAEKAENIRQQADIKYQEALQKLDNDISNIMSSGSAFVELGNYKASKQLALHYKFMHDKVGNIVNIANLSLEKAFKQAGYRSVKFNIVAFSYDFTPSESGEEIVVNYSYSANYSGIYGVSAVKDNIKVDDQVYEIKLSELGVDFSSAEVCSILALSLDELLNQYDK